MQLEQTKSYMSKSSTSYEVVGTNLIKRLSYQIDGTRVAGWASTYM